MTNGNAGAYNYVRTSGPIPLDEEYLSDLVSTRIEVLIFRGPNRDATTDALVGVVSLPLSALVSNTTDRIKGSFQISPPAAATYLPPSITPAKEAYQGTLSAEIRPDSSLADALLGGRVFTLDGATLTDLPAAWTAVAVAEAEAEAEAAGEGKLPTPSKSAASAATSSSIPAALKNSDALMLATAGDADAAHTRYVLTICFPKAFPSAYADENNYVSGLLNTPAATSALPRLWHVGTGRLAFRYEGSPVKPTAGAAATMAADARAAAAPVAAGAKKSQAAAAAAPTARSRPVTAGDGILPRPSPPASAGHWVISFCPARCFLPASRVAALSAALSRGSALPVQLRRVAVEPIAAAAAGGSPFPGGSVGLEDGLSMCSRAGDAARMLGVDGDFLVLSEETSVRGAAMLELDALLVPGATTESLDIMILPAVTLGAIEIAEGVAAAAAHATAIALVLGEAVLSASPRKGPVLPSGVPAPAHPISSAAAPAAPAPAASRSSTGGALKKVDPKAAAAAAAAVAADHPPPPPPTSSPMLSSPSPSPSPSPPLSRPRKNPPRR